MFSGGAILGVGIAGDFEGTAPTPSRCSSESMGVEPAVTRSVLFVWIVSAMTVTKVVEGCVYIRRRYYGILPRVEEFEHSALRSLSLALSSNATTLNHLIRLRGSQGVQIWKQRTH